MTAIEELLMYTAGIGLFLLGMSVGYITCSIIRKVQAK